MFTLMKNKETRNKILLILGFIIFVRIGSIIPIPGINSEYMKSIISGSGFQFFNMITGNSFSKMSLFALSISPYITASIIIQLMTVVIPKLEDLSKDGKTGQEKIQKITNVTGIIIGFIQSFFMAVGLGSKGLLNPYTWWMVLIATCIWTLGATILIIMGEKITKLDLGNGISFILLFNILSTFPGDLMVVYERFSYDSKPVVIALKLFWAIAVFMVFLAGCIYLNLSEKRIQIRFSRKNINNEQGKDLPISLNICNVMPVIFTGSIISMVNIAATFSSNQILLTISKYLSPNNWFITGSLKYTLGCIVYILLAYFFANFYLDIAFNATEIAQRLKAQGATIPGIRPGKPTSEFLHTNAFEMMVLGTGLMLCIVLGASLVCNIFGIGVLSIGGTSILICVNVIIETYKKIKTAAQSVRVQSYYKKKNNRKSLFQMKGVYNV